MRLLVVPIALLVACVIPPPEVPQQSPEERLDLAWRGHPMLDVESHPVFSSMESRVQELSDGSIIMHHMRCAQWQQPDRVNTFGGQAWSATTVDHGASGTFCCDRQFVLRNGVVERYRQVPSLGGTCSAEAAFYPAGRPPGVR